MRIEICYLVFGIWYFVCVFPTSLRNLSKQPVEVEVKAGSRP